MEGEDEDSETKTETEAECAMKVVIKRKSIRMSDEDFFSTGR